MRALTRAMHSLFQSHKSGELTRNSKTSCISTINNVLIFFHDVFFAFFCFFARKRKFRFLPAASFVLQLVRDLLNFVKKCYPVKVIECATNFFNRTPTSCGLPVWLINPKYYWQIVFWGINKLNSVCNNWMIMSASRSGQSQASTIYYEEPRVKLANRFRKFCFIYD